MGYYEGTASKITPEVPLVVSAGCKGAFRSERAPPGSRNAGRARPWDGHGPEEGLGSFLQPGVKRGSV